MKIYYAAPLFNVAELMFNQHLAEQIEKQGYDLFLPQRDGIESKTFDRDGKVLVVQQSESEVSKESAIFSLDCQQIIEANIFLFVLDGRVPDEGACFELGLAYGQKHFKVSNHKLIIGLHTDARAAFIAAPLNAMLHGAFDHIFTNIPDLIQFLAHYKK